jgi:hypothetical protein
MASGFFRNYKPENPKRQLKTVIPGTPQRNVDEKDSFHQEGQKVESCTKYRINCGKMSLFKNFVPCGIEIFSGKIIKHRFFYFGFMEVVYVKGEKEDYSGGTFRPGDLFNSGMQGILVWFRSGFSEPI